MAEKLLDLKATGRIARLRIRKGLFIDDIMQNVIPKMQETDSTDTGGYFGVFDLETGLPLDLFPIGAFLSAEKAQRYLTNCLEKADRLHRWVKCGHITSWESRDPDEMPAELRKRYGGAIVIDDLIYSFSGFSEHGDEWVCIIAAETNGGHLRLSRSRELITRLTGNPHLLT